MPRIYYRDRHLCGTPFESETINLENFQKILTMSKNNASDQQQIVTLPQKYSFVPWKRDIKGYKYAVLWHTDLPHKTMEYGDFYLPKALVFYDVKDAYFPSQYVFVACIDGKLEVRECRAGEGTMWFQQAELHTSIEDEKTVRRVEKSMKELQMLFLDVLVEP